jgi:ribosomal protein L16 Arg81 hydroxylase
MNFSEYLNQIRLGGPQNDTYLVANNGLFDSPAAKRLLDDIEIPHEYLDPDRCSQQVFLWLGPEGTVTPLHHDVMNILFVQVFGRKRVILFDPLQTPYLYNDDGVYSQIDPLSVDHSRFPLYREAESRTLILNPGEALFIPAGYWHHVEALEPSANVSFTNFVFPNSFSWLNPSLTAP